MEGINLQVPLQFEIQTVEANRIVGSHIIHVHGTEIMKKQLRLDCGKYFSMGTVLLYNAFNLVSVGGLDSAGC